FITIESPDDVNRVMNVGLPAVPEGVPYTWTKANTFEEPSVFENGFEVTGGDIEIGGAEFDVESPAVFASDVEMAAALVVAGNCEAQTVDIEGTLSVDEQTTFDNVYLTGLSFGPDATFQVSPSTAYNAGRVTFDSCKAPRLTPAIGSSPTNSGNATG